MNAWSIESSNGTIPQRIEYSENTINTSWKIATVAPKLNPTLRKRTRIYKNIPIIAKAIAHVDRTLVSLAIVGPTLLLDSISSPVTPYLAREVIISPSTLLLMLESLLSIRYEVVILY